MDLYSTYLLLSALSPVKTTANINNGSANTGVPTSSFQNLFQNIQNRQSQSNTLSAGDSMNRIFEEAAQKYGVDVNLLKAIGKAESGFDATVTSSAGAMGVMQLMPATAKYLGVSNPYNARENIMGGAKYIAQMLDQYNGNEKLALAAYNAGPGNVSKYGGIPPFTETQNYVKKVMAYAEQGVSPEKTAEAGSSGKSTYPINGSEGNSNIDKEAMLSLITLMRLQMDMKLNSLTAGSSVLGSTESQNSSIFNI